jgi:hypothetical protein
LKLVIVTVIWHSPTGKLGNRYSPEALVLTDRV